MASFRCSDIGMDCAFEATARTEDELMKKIAEHARKAHNMKTILPDVMRKVWRTPLLSSLSRLKL